VSRYPGRVSLCSERAERISVGDEERERVEQDVRVTANKGSEQTVTRASYIIAINEGPLTKNGPIDFAQSWVHPHEKIQLDLW
jgi:hypothetical protein